MADIGVTMDGHVATVELRRPPNNFIDVALVTEIATAFEALDEDPQCRAIVLCAAGKHFCAGANLAQRLESEAAGKPSDAPGKHLYHEANRLVRTKKPFVAAVQGAAVGAGLGLALVADFRVGCSESRFSANFTRQGYHPGFGTTRTLPRLVGAQAAAWLFYTGERIDGEEALKIGLIDKLVPLDQVRGVAHEMAAEIARSAPLAVAATRMTLRRALETEFAAATEREFFEQTWLRGTDDYKEGVAAMNARRLPNFAGR
jgi:enoyl-CoA hydratase/carnithine racemase